MKALTLVVCSVGSLRLVPLGSFLGRTLGPSTKDRQAVVSHDLGRTGSHMRNFGS